MPRTIRVFVRLSAMIDAVAALVSVAAVPVPVVLDTGFSGAFASAPVVYGCPVVGSISVAFGTMEVLLSSRASAPSRSP